MDRTSLTADAYWQLRYHVEQLKDATHEEATAKAAHVQTQIHVETLKNRARRYLVVLGLDPDVPYTFDDTTLTLTPVRPVSLAAKRA